MQKWTKLEILDFFNVKCQKTTKFKFFVLSLDVLEKRHLVGIKFEGSVHK